MKNHFNRTAFWVSLLITATLGLLLGMLLLVLPTDLLLKIIFIVMGIFTLISGFSMFIIGLSAIREPIGKTNLIFSILSILMGFVLIFEQSSVLLIIVGVYFVIFPIVDILVAKDRVAQIKSELPKLILGVVLLVLGPAETVEILFDIAGWTVIVLTALWVLLSVISYLKRQIRAQSSTGNRVFVDQNGDGTVDTVIIDTTGDGKPDTERTYRN